VEKKKLLKKLKLEGNDEIGGVIGKFEYKKKRYLVTVECADEATQIINLNETEDKELELGTPFVRQISIIEDVISELTENVSEQDTACPDRCIYNEVKQKEGLVCRSVAVGCVVDRNASAVSPSKKKNSSKKRKSPSSKTKSPSSKSPSRKKKKVKKSKKSKK